MSPRNIGSKKPSGGGKARKRSGPAAKKTAARVVEIGGRDLLAKVAKLHFKITPGLFPG